MNNHIAIAAVLMISAFSAIGQPPDILADLLKPPPIDPAITNIPPLSPIKPTPEKYPTLPQSPTFTDPEIITKSNQRLFSADFEIEIRDSSPFVTNVTVSAKLERKYKLTDLQTVHLLVGSTLGDNELITMGQAKLFVPLWHQARFKQETPSDAPIFINFVLTRELTREAYLRLECFSNTSGHFGHAMFYKGPKSVYFIDLKSFMPLPSEHNPSVPTENRSNTDNPINIEIL